MLGSRDVAADAVAESLVRAYRHLASCRDPSRLRTWLYRIVANRCKSYLARRDVADVPLEEAPPVADVTDNEAALERAEQLALVARALAQLAPDQREAFVLKHVEGLSYQEMADVTGERIPTLKMRVHRAREALLQVLEDHASIRGSIRRSMASWPARACHASCSSWWSGWKRRRRCSRPLPRSPAWSRGRWRPSGDRRRRGCAKRARCGLLQRLAHRLDSPRGPRS